MRLILSKYPTIAYDDNTLNEWEKEHSIEITEVPDFSKGIVKSDGNTWWYEPFPETATETEMEPSAEEDTAEMLVDHEYRITLLELGITE